VLAELCLYFELLVYLAGTFLYWFLIRELRRRSQVLPGNWPLRGLLIGLTLWYGLTLVDEILAMLLGERPDLAWLGVGLDLARAWAWLLAFPLLVHTLVGVLSQEDERMTGRGRLVTVPAYLSLLVFLPEAVRFARSGEPLLAAASRRIFPQVALYAVAMLAVAGVLTYLLSRRASDGRLAGFLRLLLGVLAAMVALLAAGALRDPWDPDAAGLDRVLRTLLLGGLLLPGALFAFYVQRYNLLRLSLSHRTLRHFTAVLALVLVVMLGGPAMGLDDVAVVRRVVAWGLVVALFLGLAYQPLLDRALRRSTALRRFFGKSMAPHDMELLMASLQDPDLDEATVLERTAAALGRWLGAAAVFARRDDAPAPFWEHYERDPRASRVHRLDPPSSRLAVLLDRHELHAVFPLRIEGRLEALLLLAASAVGGGYDMAELEAVQGVIRQLAGTLALRRLSAARLAEERLLAERAEHERLRMLGLVAASVAHEVKNPLSAMKALAQTLREDLAAEGSHADGVADLDHILGQIDRLHRTVHEILGLARPRAGAATALAGLVRSSLYVLAAEAKKRGVKLVGDAVGEVGEVPGSETAWQTVVFNLMLNAVEHTPAGARAEVRLERDGRDVVFTTSNPGAPLSPDTARRLFDPFVSDGGTGLGLALVKRRCEELKAGVEVLHDAGHVIFRVSAGSPA
jgi:signal transduction histidine kinase